MKKPRKPRLVMHGPKTAFETAHADFVSQLFTYEGWDSDFTPNPHERPRVALLVPFGAQAVPVFVDLLDSTLYGHSYWGFEGLSELARAGVDEALAELEKRVDDRRYGAEARELLATLRPARLQALGLKRTPQGVASSMRSALSDGTAPALLRALLRGDDGALVSAAIDTIYDTPQDPELIAALREVMLGPWPEARGKATFLLSKVPGATTAEALIEGMLTSGRVGNVEAVAWHPESDRLVDPLIRAENLSWLADLLERRRCAGLPVHSERAVRFTEHTLRHPKREWRFEQHDVNAAARAALQLGDPALLPALVDAVVEQNTGYAWEPLVEALRSFGDEALRALEHPGASKVQQHMRSELGQPPLDRLSLGDQNFVRGSIDHSTGGAFSDYSRALRRQRSAHAAFMLAWIDRAFGALIGDDRARWIGSLGFRDEALLRELTAAVTPLEGHRLSWRKCTHTDAARVAAAGLPGLAYLGSRDERHREQAEALLERVRAATG